MEYDVSVVSCESYDPAAVRGALAEAVDAVGGLGWVRPGMKIAIKCNLVGAYRPETAAAVHPAVARELCAMLTGRGASVVLGDSPSGPFSGAKLAGVYSAAGMHAIEETGARLNDDFSQTTADFPQGVRVKSIPVTSWLLDADCVIDLCKLKTHGLTGFTCAVKNFFGIIPGTRKTEFHYLNPRLGDFCDMLVDLSEFIKPRLVIADAVVGMEGNGPTAGTPRHIGAIIASLSPYFADLAAARLIGLDGRAPTIACAVRRGLCPDSLEKLSVYGDAAGLAVPDYRNQPPRDDLRPDFKIPAVGTLAAAIFGTGPRVNREKCVGCGTCASVCPMHSARIKDGVARIDARKCIRCFCCQEFCPKGAITVRRPPLARLISRL